MARNKAADPAVTAEQGAKMRRWIFLGPSRMRSLAGSVDRANRDADAQTLPSMAGGHVSNASLWAVDEDHVSQGRLPAAP